MSRGTPARVAAATLLALGAAALTAAVADAAPRAAGSASAAPATIAIELEGQRLAWTYAEGTDEEAVSHAVVEVSEAGELVSRRVLGDAGRDVAARELRQGHHYDVTVTADVDGTVVARGSASLTVAPALAALQLERALLVPGGSVPFTVWLQEPALDPVDVSVTGAGRVLTGDPVVVTVPAGRRGAAGTLTISPSATVGTSDLPTYAEARLAAGADPVTSRSQLVLPKATPLRARVGVPAEVTGPAPGATGELPVTVTLDRPADKPVTLVYDGPAEVGYRGTLTVPAGVTEATLPVPLTRDATADAGTRQVDLRFFDSRTLLVTGRVEADVLDPLPPTADLVLSEYSLLGDATHVGALAEGGVTWTNRGAGPARGARLIGTISAIDPLLRVTTGGVPCTTTDNGPDVAFTCRLDDVPAGSESSLWVEYAATVPGEAAIRLRIDHPDDARPGDLSVTRKVTADGAPCTITGTFGADTLTGTRGADVICGPYGASRDVVVPGGGNDTVVAGGVVDFAGSPKALTMRRTAPMAVLGWGTDGIVVPFRSWTLLTTVRGTDRADALQYDDTFALDAGAGDDVIVASGLSGQSDADLWGIDGGPGLDTLVVKNGGLPFLELDLGDEPIRGIEKVVAGDGAQAVTGGPGADDVALGTGPDTADVVDGIGGNDTVDAGPGKDECRADLGDVVRNCERVTWVPAS